jgi:hypothetical protein
MTNSPRIHENARARKFRGQKPRRNEQVKQEIAQLQLQAQVEKLHRSIEFFKEENEYIRRLVERYSMVGRTQQMSNKLTYSGEECLGSGGHGRSFP